MNITEFNDAPTDDVRQALLTCAGIPRWAEAVAAGRPFHDRPALLHAADALAADWSDDEVDGALADHPRIGERRPSDDARAAHSRREQASLGADADVQARIADANVAYEERFDRIFLIRAAGRSGAEILSEALRRLDNDDAEERIERSAQLREIALLRLEALLDGSEAA